MGSGFTTLVSPLIESWLSQHFQGMGTAATSKALKARSMVYWRNTCSYASYFRVPNRARILIYKHM